MRQQLDELKAKAARFAGMPIVKDLTAFLELVVERLEIFEATLDALEQGIDADIEAIEHRLERIEDRPRRMLDAIERYGLVSKSELQSMRALADEVDAPADHPPVPSILVEVSSGESSADGELVREAALDVPAFLRKQAD